MGASINKKSWLISTSEIPQPIRTQNLEASQGGGRGVTDEEVADSRSYTSFPDWLKTISLDPFLSATSMSVTPCPDQSLVIEKLKCNESTEHINCYARVDEVVRVSMGERSTTYEHVSDTSVLLKVGHLLSHFLGKWEHWGARRWLRRWPTVESISHLLPWLGKGHLFVDHLLPWLAKRGSRDVGHLLDLDHLLASASQGRRCLKRPRKEIHQIRHVW